MSEEETRVIIKMLDALQEEVHLAVTGIISSQLLWTKKAMEILRTQMLFYRQNDELDQTLQSIGEKHIQRDILYQCNIPSVDQRIAIYQCMGSNGKWKDIRLSFRQADKYFNVVKTKWLKPKAEMVDLTYMTVKEIKLTVEKWKESEMTALNWQYVFNTFMDEWKEIKRGLEQAIRKCNQLPSVSEENKG